MTSTPDQPHGDPTLDDNRPSVRDESSAPSVGLVVQAGVVHGGLHVHPVPEPIIPRQLPAAPGMFVGRSEELDVLDRMLDVAADGGTLVISAIGGAGGIGKTWLALRWAHRRLSRFPDGQLFVDLRGFSPDSEPLPPAVVVRGFLDGLGVEPDRIPVDPEAQAALFRSLVARRRMLIVLDNAYDSAQLVPLLPGGDSCVVLVTSRRTPTGLISRHSAHHLALDTLSADDARSLLVRRLGPARVAAEPEAVEELIAACGGLPLALGIIAGRAQASPRTPLASFLAELRDSAVGALADDDPTASLPAVFSWSYRALEAKQRQVFGLLGAAPGPDIGLAAAACLTGLPTAEVSRVLRGLEEASLIGRNAAGRYFMHDLIRRFSSDTAHEDLPRELREAALRRAVGFYLHGAHAADRLLDPHRARVPLDPPEPGCRPEIAATSEAALAWFAAELPCLLAAQRTATAYGWHQAVWHLAWALGTYHYQQGHGHDRVAVWRAGLAAAEHLHDDTVRALAHRSLGAAHADLGQHDDAIDHLHRSLTLAESHDDRTSQAHIHYNLALAWDRSGDVQRSLHHATRSLDLYRALDKPVWEAAALNAVGWCFSRLGDHDQALLHCEAALALHRRHHDPTGEANTLDSLGYIAHRMGNHQESIDHYRNALGLLRDLGHTYSAADALDRLGHPYTALGRHDQAHTVWSEALDLYQRQGRTDDTDRVRAQLHDLEAATRATPSSVPSPPS